MRKGQRAKFLDPPRLIIIRPRGRYFLIREAGSHALDGVRARDDARSENTDQTTAQIRNSAAARFARDERPASGGNSGKKRVQGRIFKMMQKQSGDAQIVAFRAGCLRPIEGILTHHVHSPRKPMEPVKGIRSNRRMPVEQRDLNALPSGL